MGRDEFYMREAINAARQNIDKLEYPFGCCIVTSNNVMVAVANSCFSYKDPTRHAEINAIRELCSLRGKATHEDAVIYSTMEPCTMCMGAINWARIPRLVYGLSIKDSIKYGFDEVELTSHELASNFPYKIDITGGLLADECQNLFDNWSNKKKMLDLFNRRKGKHGNTNIRNF